MIALERRCDPTAPPSTRAARTGAILAEARRLEASGDPAAAARAAEMCWRAVTMNDGLCRKWAARWGNRSVPFEDRLQTARIGMWRAAQKYDPARRVPFPGLARWWVRATLTREHPQHDVAAHTEERMRLISRLEGEGLDDAAIAAFLGCDLADVRAARARVLASHPASLDAPVGDGDATIGGTLAAPVAEYDLDDLGHVLAALEELPDQQRQVLVQRFGLVDDRRTLAEVGDAMGLSRERIRQIETTAMRNLQEAIMAGTARYTRERLRDLLERHPGQSVRQAAAALRVTESRVSQLVQELALVRVRGRGRGGPARLYLPGTEPKESQPAPLAPLHGGSHDQVDPDRGPGGDEAPRRGSEGGAGEGGAADREPDGGQSAPVGPEPEAAPSASPGAGPHALTDSTPSSPEPGSQTLVPQAPASGSVQAEAESDRVVEAPAVGDRGWWVGLGPGELAETAERLQEELDALRAAAQRPPEPPPDVTLRAVAAVLDLMERPGVDIVARVALLVGEVRALRRSA